MYHNFGQKRTKRDIVTVCNSCIFLSVLSKQMLKTMCQDKIFEEIVGRNHLNFVNPGILMFLMIKVPQNTWKREVNHKIGSEAFRLCARTKFLRKLVVEIIWTLSTTKCCYFWWWKGPKTLGREKWTTKLVQRLSGHVQGRNFWGNFW